MKNQIQQSHQQNIMMAQSRLSLNKTSSVKSTIDQVEYSNKKNHAENPIMKPRQIRTAKVTHQSAASGGNDMLNGQFVSRLRINQMEKKKEIREQIMKKMRQEDMHFTETLRAIQQNQLSEYMEQAVNHRMVKNQTSEMLEINDFKSPGTSSPFRPFSATVGKPKQLASMRNLGDQSDQKSNFTMRKNGRDTFYKNKNQSKLMNESTKLDSESNNNKSSMFSLTNNGVQRSRVGSAVTAKNSQRSLNHRLSMFNQTIASPMNNQNNSRDQINEIIKIKSPQTDSLSFPSQGRISIWNRTAMQKQQDAMQIIDIDHHESILEEDDPITDYDNEDSQIQLIQTSAMQVMQAARLRRTSDSEKVQKMATIYSDLLSKIKYRSKPKAIFAIIKSQGDIFIEYRDLQEAIVAYKQLKNFCEEVKLYKEKMGVYAQLGYCYRIVRSHAIAVDYFKKQLEIAWDLKNQTAEMQAYDNIAMEYFYMGDLDKAKFYQDRMLRGKLENKDSIIRSVCINILSSKREKIHTGQKKMTVKKEVLDKLDEERMADYGHSRAYQLLPHFADNLEGQKKENSMSDTIPSEAEERKMDREKREELQKLRSAKVSVVRSNITVKSLKKNKDKYDIQKLKKDQMSNYHPFCEDRFLEMVRKAHQRCQLGDDIKAKPEKYMGHKSLLRTMPLHAVSQVNQIKTVEEIIFNMLILTQNVINKTRQQ